MTYKILLPLEDKRFAKAQLDFLYSHKLKDDTEVILLGIVKPIAFQDYGYAIPHHFFENLIVEEQKWAEKLLNECAAELKNNYPDLHVSQRVEFGSPALEILALAKRERINWIVIGSHGRSVLEKFFLGSVSQAVVNRAQCAVTVVRLEEQQEMHKTEAEHEQFAAKPV